MVTKSTRRTILESAEELPEICAFDLGNSAELAGPFRPPLAPAYVTNADPFT
jgi:hypothetical protein